ncbi:MAG TPA: hypothetical protein ENJ82_14885 [Bacteroidetes bacterium]|nr:hypothetical protein [Bacteroidota bacterium]
MARFGLKPQGGDAPKGAGTKFKILVRIAALGVIGGIFLDFLLGESILTMFTGIQDGLNNVGLMDTVTGIFGRPTPMGSLTRTVVLLAFVFIPLMGLSMLLRAKYKGGQMTFLIVFNIGAWLLVNFFGAEAGIDGNFFVNTGPGYWISCGALFLPFVGMFFLDESI